MDMLDVTNFALDRILSPRTAVSSAIPSSEVAGTGRHSLRETAPEDLGGVPPDADRGPATVGVLPGSDRARVYALERVISQLHDLLPGDVDAAYVLVQETYLAIHGPQS